MVKIMANKDLRVYIIEILLLIISILYIVFLYLDICDRSIFISTDEMKYLCIILCFTISLLIGENFLNRKDLFLLQISLFFTVIADYFFLITHKYILGIVSFCIVQIIYSVRHDIKNKVSTIKKFIMTLILVLIIYLIISNFIITIDLIFVVGIYYAIALIVSVIKAIKSCKYNYYPSPNKYMIAWGMILFLLCDIHVGFANIQKVIKVSPGLLKRFLDKSISLIWFFYLPSQILLTLSGYKYSLDKKEG